MQLSLVLKEQLYNLQLKDVFAQPRDLIVMELSASPAFYQNIGTLPAIVV